MDIETDGVLTAPADVRVGMIIPDRDDRLMVVCDIVLTTHGDSPVLRSWIGRTVKGYRVTGRYNGGETCSLLAIHAAF